MKKYNLVFLTSLLGTVHLYTFAAPEVPYEQCQSNFSYQLARYQGTTDKNNGTSQWCYLKQAIDGQTWGNVRTETIPEFKTVSGKSCQTPSNYQGENFYGCATINHDEPWCYTDDQGNWEACAPVENEPLLSHTHPQANKRLDRVALGSCFKTKGDMPQALAKLISHQPDLFLWLGDNIYADTTDMDTMRQKYDDKKRNIDYQKFLAANIPTMATWDDHDYGANNDGKHYPQRAASQKEYLRHFDAPADDPRLNGQAGVYEAQMLGPANESTHVITLDARYFRSPTFTNYGACEGDKTTILGEQQWQWLEQQLNTPSEIKLIASGIQFLPPLYQGRSRDKYCAYGDGKKFEQAIAALNETGLSGTSYESWAEVPTEREKLLRLVQKSINSGKTKAVIFLSGDQHWGELLQKTIPKSTEHGDAVTVYEVTASGFGQNWPYHIENPLRLPVYADTKGNGQYEQACQFPFSYGGTTYRGCTTKDHAQPWCYTQVDSSGKGIAGEWGNCAPSGATIPTGQVGIVSNNVSNLTTSDRHLINKSGSNYGMVDIDWQNKQIKLSIQTAEEEAVSTIIKF
ncbi:alkaline phosphatase D family protein [Pseudoalteromonas luteoviolacea]|uniref:Phosphodiesterase n=1 Tax=Pseudoalteromonas luteoviolacea S4054 TaxID=1129367 RepID=A0A0F6A7G3_9GAMM|nr:alkaline phosphatase D family protein [Pseudoalteromonas luteoviolacea]AOT09318.1 phosphodiesterase [Pseudoalteromonas luteoviolacea]AOT14230.1 phosphodiesterase [Pseudoalteromonas luteoviolacea]AOT19146.1 phosphodiesterase [Pseudoalteromonas luteoviolacea]KKE82110.1 phosphodiesterase [Pseudoalteromonas luteoviolacea S4054]KZN73422.1 phosphodiesterase [Pseudoalteromonas luteoviolacea S4047-1]